MSKDKLLEQEPTLTGDDPVASGLQNAVEGPPVPVEEKQEPAAQPTEESGQLSDDEPDPVPTAVTTPEISEILSAVFKAVADDVPERTSTGAVEWEIPDSVFSAEGPELSNDIPAALNLSSEEENSAAAGAELPRQAVGHEPPQKTDDHEAETKGKAVKSEKAEKAEKNKKTEKSRRAEKAERSVKGAKRKAPLQKPGTNYKKISRSRVRVNAPSSLKVFFEEVQHRQEEALPAFGKGLKSEQKRLGKRLSVNRPLNGIRYIILILMAMCLCGRSYSWMSLGFMSGSSGLYISVMMAFLSMLVNWQSVWRGLRDIRYMRYSLETMLFAVTVLSLMETWYLKDEDTLLPLLTMSWCACGIYAMKDDTTRLRSVRAVSSDRRRDGIRVAEKCWDGAPGIGRGRSDVEGLVRHLAYPDVWHTLYVPFNVIWAALMLIISAYLAARLSQNYLKVLVTLLSVGMPVALVGCCARPWELLSRNLSRKGVVAGWFGMKQLSGKKALLIGDRELFPTETVACTGFRSYTNAPDSTMISYAASILLEADVGLEVAFAALLRECQGAQMYVTGLRPEEGGIRGIIHNEVVNIGSADYMRLCGVTVPKTDESYSVYMAVNGLLAAEFFISYAQQRGANRVMQEIAGEPMLTTLITARNFYVNPRFITDNFHTTGKRITCPKAATRRRLSAKKTFREASVCGYVLKDGLTGLGKTIVGARRVYRFGIVFTVCSMFVTLVLTLQSISAMLHGTAIPAPQTLVLIQLVLGILMEFGARVASK